MVGAVEAEVVLVVGGVEGVRDQRKSPARPQAGVRSEKEGVREGVVVEQEEGEA